MGDLLLGVQAGLVELDDSRIAFRALFCRRLPRQATALLLCCQVEAYLVSLLVFEVDKLGYLGCGEGIESFLPGVCSAVHDDVVDRLGDVVDD